MADVTSRFPLKLGLFGIGLDAYWPQFAGIAERLEGYLAQVARRLELPGVEVVNLGLIDTPEKAVEAGHRFRQTDVDLIFLHVTTYALSSTVLPVVRRAKVPVIMLNLYPVPAIDYAWFNALGDRTAMTGEWLAHCAACPVPEIANVFNRAQHSLPSGHGHAARRPRLLERSCRVDRGRAGRARHGAQSPGRDGALLRRNARHLHRPDAAVRHFRRTHRDG